MLTVPFPCDVVGDLESSHEESTELETQIKSTATGVQ